MRRRSGHKAAYLLVVAALSTGLLGACGSSGSSGAKSGDVKTTATAGSGSQDETATSPEASTGDADAGAKLTDAEGKAGPDHTVSIAEKTMTPSKLSISKGDIVTFIGSDPGVHSVIVPGLDGMTVTDSMWETFKFPKAGTFVVTDNIGRGTVTITVS